MLKRDDEAKQNAPKVIKDKIDSQQKRSYSTSARRMAVEVEGLQTTMQGLLEQPPTNEFGRIHGRTYRYNGDKNVKFEWPETTPTTFDHLKRRYDPVVDQVTKSLMRHGKLSLAQKVGS